MSDYSIDDFTNAINQTDLNKGDTIFVHSNLTALGRPKNIRSSEELCQSFLDSCFGKIGLSGTIVVPAFTYSFPKEEIFDPKSPTKQMGAFSEWVRKQPGSIRSLDPCFSIIALGGAAQELTEDMPQNSFGEDSFFDRLLKRNGMILNINLNSGSTFVHFVERCLGVPYRFDKTFSGIINHEGEKEAKSTIWVRDLTDPVTEANFSKFHRLSTSAGLNARFSIGRGSVNFIRSRDTYDLIEDEIQSDPLFLTNGMAKND